MVVGKSMKSVLALGLPLLMAQASHGAEVTIKNDSLTDFGSAAIVWGFAEQERAASWLTSPCNGDLRAVQIFWRSPTGTSGQSIEWAIDVHRAGTFPTPGAIAATIAGPVLTDGVLNEWRYLDENNVVPLQVPVAENETIVVSFTFDQSPEPFVGPSVVRDTDGIQPGRNAIYANVSGGTWFNAATLGVTGDWVIRAVVDCQAVAQEADVAVAIAADPTAYVAGEPLTYTVVVDNAGPAAANPIAVVNILPPALTGATWTCVGAGGGTCTASGSGSITDFISLAAGGAATYTVTGVVDPGATGPINNTASAVVSPGIIDPVPDNNTATLQIQPAKPDDTLFADGFEETDDIAT